MRRLLPLLLAMSTCGCAVNLWPHTVQSVPAVEGVVSRSGVPVVGARVHVLATFPHGSCARSRHSALTDEDGRFAVRGDRELELFFVVGDHLAEWAVCIEESDGTMTEARREFRLGHPPDEMRLHCDLDQPPVKDEGVSGVCV